ncbi:MAG: signal peptidase I [Syntrophobacterales bacterium]|nr:signal peptidase I [Syntrophobacterales bacterium]
MEEQTQTKKTAKSIALEYIKSIIIALILAFLIRTFIIQAFKIPSGSMIPTLLVGDHILVTKFTYNVKLPIVDITIWHRQSPKRGDIIVFKYPLDPDKDFIKRVIGTPGDEVVIKNKQVYVNGQELKEPYVQYTDPRIVPAELSPRDNLGPIRVPPHSLFVMGDNRDESYDSRFWKFVDVSAVRGKAFIIYWSWNPKGNFSLNPKDSFLRWDRIGNIIR